MKIGVLQRVLAGYRVPFFDELAARFGGSLTLFAGHARREEMIDESVRPWSSKYLLSPAGYCRPLFSSVSTACSLYSLL